MNGNEYKQFTIVQDRKVRTIIQPSIKFCLRMDLRHFFPNWDRMSEPEQKLWREKYRAYCMRCEGRI